MTVVPPSRVRYLSDISNTVRSYHEETIRLSQLASEADGLCRSVKVINGTTPTGFAEVMTIPDTEPLDTVCQVLTDTYHNRLEAMDAESLSMLREIPQLRKAYQATEHSYTVRGKEIKVENYTRTLSDNMIPKVSLPQTNDWATLLEWRRKENLPGSFPFTAGVFPYKRSGEDPTRMFAGEGHPERTNRRFHYLSLGQKAAGIYRRFQTVLLCTNHSSSFI